ncbi:MAG: Acetyl-/propionyl-coenzyme A carboxylase alpha chain [Steroidobacteraceae bacterium]|nr:Acetyl-/propionyl-coenzyme A carboxylase alpha chain [Steroidobacteraceae bacterium]
MFKKILIANRGEIACRVIRTARRLGIATVAVHSDADRDARHVALADEAIAIGPAPSRESYLVMDRIIAACKSSGAEALHPGYGFLSENEQFARRVEEEGIVFIGPKHRSIAAMGDKISSKALAAKARVNTIPGHNAPIETADEAVKVARRIGYPVMIKASAGGGGKGLRVAWKDQDAFDGYTSCRNEARASFGDDRVFIEKFIEEPRHIEIQVLGDAHGNCVYLWERECSIQRRHQKVIEEAPSPFLDAKTRRAMGEQAVALAKAVDYQSAGTVEFVVGKDRSFYFLEMNTRLQVEHPVTECITGFDLVEQMIRIAAGEKLAFRQEDIPLDGWAIECRINAEDPFRNFLPSTGRLVKFRPPREGGGVRVDTGVEEGGEIPMYYDSMIAKLIVHGEDRSAAIARMREALNAFVIRGISSNIPFQAALLAHPRFASGQFNTGFIAEEYPEGFTTSAVTHAKPDFLLSLAAAAHRRRRERASGITGQMSGSEVRIPEDFVVVITGRDGRRDYTPVSVLAEGSALQVTVGDHIHRITLAGAANDIVMQGEFDGEPWCAQLERIGLDYRIAHNGATVLARVLTPRAAELLALMPVKAAADLSKFLLSPMPGLLVEIAVAPGQSVVAGEKLAVIEAMKMENTLFASQDGVVEDVMAKKGDNLAVDQVILRFA